ncbi:MAG: valine--tRNA ligase [Buchnera aphidicola (Periphyllus lyropictus)]|uniref:valine--tRNA ligase n=1 Tax=Buchnera aphidicola TaxID=9 RepID=UPI001EBB552D|nr:valine--tRNA ligase [Buchnera aphidicola]NIH16584.1 valine--tRNA ligase [Buchnera aphidicola (Periphyllus lyropictus)]USS94474.1 valine--tRNA ligase [Buchnera aphidicola (Periphyllus lyropictus)]
MKKKYNPNLIEKSLYKHWEKNKCFNFSLKKSFKKSFCIIMPPPNITGKLHIGHALQQTIMDILIRFYRMKGRNTLFQVGTDHAGIATQLLIEKKILKKYKILKTKNNKKFFLKKTWKWVKKYKKKIFDQIKRLGNSIDWNREKFTLDPDISRGVKKAFIILYKKGLIYKKKKIVNWDMNLKTVISDLEVINKNICIKMWYIKYFFENKNIFFNKKNYILIATTRPETIFGDSAIAVHPNDKRYKKYIGMKVIIPIIKRKIPIICDYEIEIKKGTGCVKITPAHDFLDYKIGERNFLPIIKVFSFDGKIKKKVSVYNFKGKKLKLFKNFIPKKFHFLDRFLAREKILKYLFKKKLIVKIKKLDSSVPFGERSNTIIEPMLTNQWFLKTSILSKKAILAVKNKEIKFFPKKYKNMYLSWMKNLEDWCISRQLWWGHTIPIWYDKNKNVYVGKNENYIRKKYFLKKSFVLKKEKDVLDTWFSSSLWTFLTLGWPKKTNELKNFHPTNVIISGFDIIFFWIAKMIMLTMNIIKDKKKKSQIPFKKVYITGLIRDDQGRKMSKSKNNVIDPIDLIDGISLKKIIYKRTKEIKDIHTINLLKKNLKKNFPNGIQAFGADSLRFTCIALSTNTRTIVWDMNRLKGYRNFCNKLWNASYFVMKNTFEIKFLKKSIKMNLSLLDKWIFSELNLLIKNYIYYIKNYRFDIIANLLYDFFWNKFCDWYLEITKNIIKNGTLKEIKNTKINLFIILKILLKLFHPILPFITDYIWKKVIVKNKNPKFISLIKKNFPKFKKKYIDKESTKNMLVIQKIFSEIRSIRFLLKIKYNKIITIILKNGNKRVLFIIKKYNNFLKKIMYLKNIKIYSNLDSNLLKTSIVRSINNFQLYIPIKKIINKKLELKNLIKKFKIIKKKYEIVKIRVSNNNFLNFAPNKVIKKEKEKLKVLKIKLKNLKNYKKILLSL